MGIQPIEKIKERVNTIISGATGLPWLSVEIDEMDFDESIYDTKGSYASSSIFSDDIKKGTFHIRLDENLNTIKLKITKKDG